MGQAPDRLLGFCPTVQNHDGENLATLEINDVCAINAQLYRGWSYKTRLNFSLVSQL